MLLDWVFYLISIKKWLIHKLTCTTTITTIVINSNILKGGRALKFSVQQNELNKHINIAQRGISNRSTLQILEGILIEAKDNRLKLTSTDLEISIETTLDSNVIEEGKVVINSRILGDIVKKLPNDTVFFDIENNKVNIKCQKSDFNIVSNPGEDYPELPIVIETAKFNIPQNILKTAIRQTSFTTSQDESRAVLTGVLFEIEDGILTFVSLDGYRLSMRKEEIGINESLKLIVPARVLNELNKIIEDTEDPITLAIANGQIVFTLRDTVIYSKLLEGQFFNYKDIVRTNHNTTVLLNRKNLLDSLERASLLAREQRANLVKLSITDDNLSIKSNSEMGDVYEEVELINKEGEDVNIAFNSRYLMDGVRVIDSEEIELNFVSSLNPCIMRAKDDEKYIYLVLPVRLAQDDF